MGVCGALTTLKYRLPMFFRVGFLVPKVVHYQRRLGPPLLKCAGNMCCGQTVRSGPLVHKGGYISLIVGCGHLTHVLVGSTCWQVKL